MFINRSLRALQTLVRAYPIECTIFVLLLTTYAYFYPAAQHNSSARLAQMRSIWEDGVLDVNKFYFVSGDLITFKHEGASFLYPNKAPATTFFGLLPFGFWSFLLRGLIPDPSDYWAAVAHLTSVSSIGLLSAAAAAFTVRMLRRAGSSAAFAILAVVGIWLGSIAFPFSILFMSHQQAGAQLALAFALLFRLRHDAVKNPTPTLAAAGLLLGLTIATEYPTVLLVAPLGVYGLATAWTSTRPGASRLTALTTLGLWSALGGSVLLFYNVMAFGEAFHIPYESYLEGDTLFTAHRLGYLGVHWPGWSEFLHVLSEITIKPKRGLLYLGIDGLRVYACNPVLWLVLPGLFFLYRESRLRAEAVLIGFMTVGYLCFNACYGDSIVFWGGGTSLGPRHLVPLLSLLALPLAWGACRLRLVFLPLLAVSVFYMLVASSIEPRVPYVYENPARDMYLPRYLEGSFSRGRGSLFIERDIAEGRRTAFNLAEVAGLPQPWQLVPLLGVWCALGLRLIRLARPEPQVPPVPGAAAVAVPRRQRRRKGTATPRRPAVWAFRLSAAGAGALLAAGTVTVGFVPVLYDVLAPQTVYPSVGLIGDYYTNAEWKGEAFKRRIDPEIAFDWWGHPPVLPPFSVSWNGKLRVAQTGKYQFRLQTADSAEMEVAGKLVIDSPGASNVENFVGEIELEAGEYPIRLRYMNQAGDSLVRLYWSQPGVAEEIVPAHAFRPADDAPLEANLEISNRITLY